MSDPTSAVIGRGDILGHGVADFAFVQNCCVRTLCGAFCGKPYVLACPRATRCETFDVDLHVKHAHTGGAVFGMRAFSSSGSYPLVRRRDARFGSGDAKTSKSGQDITVRGTEAHSE